MRFSVLLTCLLSCGLLAATPGIINYQGRVSVGATAFTGTGQFRFALVNADGTTTFWSNDGTSTAGSQPTAAVSLPVNNGLYAVLLGDTSVTGITQTIPASVFSNTDVRLRVWFNDGTANGVQQLSPDQRIVAMGYALTSASVNATSSDSGFLVNVTNTGTGGGAGTFVVNNPAGNSAALLATTNANNAAVTAFQSGATNSSAIIQTSNTSNAADCLGVVTNGTGNGATFTIANASNGSNAVFAQTSGVGVAVVGFASGNGEGGVFSSNGTAPALRLDYNGSGNIAVFRKNGTAVSAITSTGSFGMISDKRLKTNILPIPHASEKLRSLRGVSYDWINVTDPNSKHDIGFIAQELISTMPEAVTKGADGHYMVAYTKFVPLLVEGFKEIDQRREALETEVEQLKKQNEDLMNRLDRLEKLLETKTLKN